MKQREVRVGQRFRKHERMPTVWELAGISQHDGHCAHVRLVSTQCPEDTKFISLVTLVDRRYYVLESESDRQPGSPRLS